MAFQTNNTTIHRIQMEIKTEELDQPGVAIAQRGFTLVEIIAVMMILGLISALAVPRYIDLETNAKKKAIIAAIAELNGRERIVWANEKSSESGYIDDDRTFSLIDTNLGAGYAWNVLPTASGGSLRFKDTPPTPLRRTSSAVSQPAFWNISTEPPPDDEGDSGDSGNEGDFGEESDSDGGWWSRFWRWWSRR